MHVLLHSQRYSFLRSPRPYCCPAQVEVCSWLEIIFVRMLFFADWIILRSLGVHAIFRSRHWVLSHHTATRAPSRIRIRTLFFVLSLFGAFLAPCLRSFIHAQHHTHNLSLNVNLCALQIRAKFDVRASCSTNQPIGRSSFVSSF